MNEVRSYRSYQPEADPSICEGILKQIKWREALRDKLNNASDAEIERLYNLMVAP